MRSEITMGPVACGDPAFAIEYRWGSGVFGHLGLVPTTVAMDKRIMTGLLSLAQAARALLDYALPSRCSGCGSITAADHTFCSPCWGTLRFLGAPCCAVCGIPMEQGGETDSKCGACFSTPPPWKSARAALAYGDISRTVAIRLKYGRRTGLAKLMARYMLPLVSPAIISAGEGAMIVPVPLHRWRLWARGFNQAMLISRFIARSLSIDVDPFVLRRVKATRPLRDMGYRERRRTVDGAFSIMPDGREKLRGKIVLLIDDIHTSGATAQACTQALLAGGAAEVHLLCWARVLQDGAGN